MGKLSQKVPISQTDFVGDKDWWSRRIPSFRDDFDKSPLSVNSVLSR